MQHPENRYGLTVVELERLAARVRHLEQQTMTASPSATVPGGAEGGGILLDDGRREPLLGTRPGGIMGLADSVRQMAAGVFLERPGRGKSLDQWSAALEKNGAAIDQRAGNGKDEVKAAKVLRHISGIERWGQSRLRVFLGAPFARDEYDGYQPGTDLTLDEQRAFWRTTRAETIALTQTTGAGQHPRRRRRSCTTTLGRSPSAAGCATWTSTPTWRARKSVDGTVSAPFRRRAILRPMRSNETVPTRVGFWAVLLLSVFAWAPAAFPGYWQGLTGFSAVWNAAHPAPIASVADQPDLWRGTGSATFLLAQPWLVFGLPATTAVRISFILCFVLGGLAVYAWLSGRLGDRSAALAGVIYMLLPPVLATVYVRGSLADTLLLALLPLILAGLTGYGERRSLAGAAVAVFGLLWLWRSQAGLAAVASVVVLAYALFVERNWGAVLIAAVASGAGLVSLWPLWTTLAPPWVDFRRPLSLPAPALRRHLAGGAQHSRLAGRLSLPVGSAGHGVRRDSDCGAGGVPGVGGSNRSCAGCWSLSTSGAAILILSTLAVSAPLWQVTGAGRLLTYPWQLLLVAAPLLAAAAGALPSPAARPARAGLSG